MNNAITPSGIEAATFRVVAQCFNLMWLACPLKSISERAARSVLLWLYQSADGLVGEWTVEMRWAESWEHRLRNRRSYQKDVYRVIRNDCRGFNNLSYTIHLRQEYVVAQIDLEIIKVFFYDVRCAVVMHFSAWSAFTKMAAEGSEKAFFVLTFHYRVDVCRITECTYRAPVRHVTKTWSVVLLNKKIHILLSQVYCV